MKFSFYLKEPFLAPEPVLEALSDELKEGNFPNMTSLHDSFRQELVERQENFEQIIELGHKDEDAFIAEVKKLDDKGKAALRELIHVRRDVELFGALKILPWKKLGQTKLLANIFLEKVIYADKSSYDSNTAEWTTFALARALERALDRVGPVPGETVSPEIEELTLKYLKETFLPLIRNCGFMVREKRNSTKFAEMFGEKLYEEKLVDAVSDLELGESILIPWGMFMHWMGVYVERNTDDTVKITLYNTGKGIREHHYQWNETHRFQTFLSVDSVPIKNLQNSETWERLRELKRSLDAAEVYKFFTEELCQGGRVLPPSEFSEDYESSQVGGSCAYQFQLAMLRHQLLHLTDVGTKKERLGLYKLLKAQLFHVYATDELKDLDQTIQDASVTKLEKLASDIQLAQLCSDEESYAKTCGEIKTHLELIGMGEIGKSLDVIPKTNLGRYALLRDVSNKIAEKWLEDPASIEKMEPSQKCSLQFALAKYQHQKGKLDERLKIIDKYFKERHPNLGAEMLYLFLNTPFPMQGINWITEHVSEEDMVDVGEGFKRENASPSMQALGDIVLQLAIYEERKYYLKQLKEKYKNSPKVCAFIDYVSKKAIEQTEKKESLDL